MPFTQSVSWKIFDLWCVQLIFWAPNPHSITFGQRTENTIFSHGIWAVHSSFSVSVSLPGKMLGVSQKFSPPVKSMRLGFWLGFLSSSSWVADTEGEPLYLVPNQFIEQGQGRHFLKAGFLFALYSVQCRPGLKRAICPCVCFPLFAVNNGGHHKVESCQGPFRCFV